MKKKLFFSISLLLSIFISSSCIFMGPSIKGNGNVVKESRSTPPFKKVRVTRGMNVYISQGENTAISVEADENLLDIIETKVENETLKITTTANIRESKSKKVFVTIPEILSVNSVAGSNVFSETIIQSKNLELSSTAGSNIEFQVYSDELNVTATAGANINLNGTAQSFTGKATAGSNIKAEDLITTNCKAQSSSGANIWIAVNGDFEGQASSGGNVFYNGNPGTVNIESSSGGNVTKM